MNRRDRAFYLAVAVGVAAVVVVVLATRRAKPTPLGDPSSADWCASGYVPIPGNGCFAGVTSPRAPLVVYLHGMYAPSGADDEAERQARLARLANERGVAVLALRGRQGQCLAENVREWWCWPSNERNASDGPGVVASWNVALANAEARIEGRPAKRWLLGFSNGAYFAGIIALKALLPFDAVAIAHAGPTDPVTRQPSMPPILLVTADEDLAVTSMMRFDVLLSSVNWPHAIVTRDGGHDLTEHDVTMALTFFERVRREALPLSPPLSLRRPRPNLPEASVADSPAAANDAGDEDFAEDDAVDADTDPPFDGATH
jgi:predicted esterase